MGRSRDIADFLGKTELSNANNNRLLDTTFNAGLDSGAVLSIVDTGLDSAAVINLVGTGLTVYDTPNLLPTSGLTAGDQAFVTSNNRIYISNGSGWYNVATINSTPTFSTAPQSGYSLATDLTPTIITLVAEDSDGTVITYSATDSGMDGIATLSQDSSVFTITPLHDSAGGGSGSFSITFQATDGIGIASELSTFSLFFGPNYDLLSTPTVDISYGVIGFSTNSYYTPGIFAYNNVSADYTGEYFIVGDHYQPNQSAEGQYGIFKRTGNTITLETQVTGASYGNGNYSYFGRYVGMNNDGNVALIFNGGGNLGYQGWITTRTGSTWSGLSNVISPNFIGAGKGFAHDGNIDRIILQDPYVNNNQGQAHIYTRSGTSFSFEQTITSPTPVNNSYFSFDIEMNETGDLVAIAEIYGNNYGSIDIFERSGTTWTSTATLTTGNTSNFNGIVAVQMAKDASVIIGLAGQENSNDGAVYVWYRNGASWTNRTTYDQKIISPESPSGASGGLGWSRGTISPDGNYFWLHKGRENLSNLGISLTTMYKNDGNSFNLLSPSVDIYWSGLNGRSSVCPIVYSKDGYSLFYNDGASKVRIYDG